MTASDAALELSGVEKHYGDFVAVGDLSFSVPTGVIYGILGPNGAGKTTTLRMINDILAPDRGTIRLFGLPPGPDASRRVGYLPEERGLYPKMKVVEVLEFFGELRGLSHKQAVRGAGTWLEKLGLTDWTKNKVQDLSKGMQQKVQFATALLHEPDLLILDEPWSGLDPINAEVLREVVMAQREAGKTILFSTHLMEQAEEICDHVCIIAKGRKALDGELAGLKRAAGGDRVVGLDFESAASRDTARDKVLGDAKLVDKVRERKDGFEVELAADISARALMKALLDAGVDLRRFEVSEPTLRQIFVDRVGASATADTAGRKTES